MVNLIFWESAGTVSADEKAAVYLKKFRNSNKAHLLGLFLNFNVLVQSKE